VERQRKEWGEETNKAEGAQAHLGRQQKLKKQKGRGYEARRLKLPIRLLCLNLESDQVAAKEQAPKEREKSASLLMMMKKKRRRRRNMMMMILTTSCSYVCENLYLGLPYFHPMCQGSKHHFAICLHRSLRK